MRKINKLAAAIAVAVGVGAASTANAVIELKPNGRGDALLFPIYHGFFENYFTISNIENAWIQGHLRFRGAAWSGELRDFDVILSPGDVMVFRVADIDGDGEWEIDQTLDPNNFRYTGMFANADMSFTCRDGTGNAIVGCMESSGGLIPSPNLVIQVDPTVTFGDRITQGVIDYQRHAGYVEFIGEAVLDGMNGTIMGRLLNANPTPAEQPDVRPWIPYRTQVFNRLGTTAWVWSDADGSRGPNNNTTRWGDDLGLSDVPNSLSGTAFITNPGWSHGLAYNAETLVDFRTATCGGDSVTVGDGGLTQDGSDPCASYVHGAHRIDNYRANGEVPVDSVSAYTQTASSSIPGNASGSTYPTRRSVGAAAHPRTLPGPIAGFNPLAENRAVIVHNENGIVANAGGASPNGDYVYWWDATPTAGRENRCDEQAIAFNNTWGPTLADGDDYDMSASFANIGLVGAQQQEILPSAFGIVNAYGDQWNLRTTGCSAPPSNKAIDDFDCNWSLLAVRRPVNSIAEVDEAIRVAGQTFTAYYMDGDIFDKSGQGLGRADGINSIDTLTTQFVSFFPTKFFHFEQRNITGACGSYIPASLNPFEVLIALRAIEMVRIPKLANVQVWDIEENPIGREINNQCISPATLEECFTGTQNINFPFEVGVMGIDFVKSVIAPGIPGQPAGRVLFDLLNGSDKGVPTVTFLGGAIPSDGFVGLLYAFEWDGFPPSVIAHWRSMNR